MKFITIITLFLFVINTNAQKISGDIDCILDKYNEEKYFSYAINILYNKCKDDNIKLPDAKKIIFRKSIKHNGFNVLLIPQISILIDPSNENKFNLCFDSINPINRVIIFNKNEYYGSLLFIKAEKPFFCSCLGKTSAYTNFYCGKYIYREKNYTKSLKKILKNDPVLVFKDSKYERVWFYINKNRKIDVFTYESDFFELKDFFKIKNLSYYSLPIHYIKTNKE